MATTPIETAKLARLRYVSDQKPGFARRRRGRNFTYYDTEGALLRDPEHLSRIRALAIPPAWTAVWISPYPNSHIQATGRDARGRKQYRYHSRWSASRNEQKFGRLLAFAQALPQLRARIATDLGLPGLPRSKVLATLVRLLETTLIRVGNEEYARANESYGLTTLRNEHVEVLGSVVHFHFKGKSGIEHDVDLRDRRLARIVKACQELPGQELFEYRDDSGEVRSIGSADVNEYLHELTAEEFTAKDFRTWAGTLCAVQALQGFDLVAGLSKTQGKRNVVQAIKQVALRLGNTPTVCRKYYIHPAVLQSYETGSFGNHFTKLVVTPSTETPKPALFPEEEALMAFLSAATSAP